MENKDFIPQIENIDEKALDFLNWLKVNHSGKYNPVMAKHMKVWGVPREIRKLVHHLRKKGYPVCSGCRGYFYGTNQEEVKESIDFILNAHKYEAVKGLEESMRLYA